MNEAQSGDERVVIPLQPGSNAWCRRIVRGMVLVCITLALVVVWFVGLPITWIQPKWRRKWRHFVFRTWSRTSLAICSIRVEVVGALPVQPCFLVANHLGYVDVLVIAASIDATFVSMKEIERWPLFGSMARQFGTVFIDRAQKRDIPSVNRELESAFERSDAVVVFPEGRHTRGASVLEFRAALLEPAARANRPVAWAVLHYATSASDPPASIVIPWVGVAFWRQALVLLAVKRVEARLEFGEDVVRGSDRKELARILHAKVSGCFVALE